MAHGGRARGSTRVVQLVVGWVLVNPLHGDADTGHAAAGRKGMRRPVYNQLHVTVQSCVATKVVHGAPDEACVVKGLRPGPDLIRLGLGRQVWAQARLG